jgi:hypothetical protein
MSVKDCHIHISPDLLARVASLSKVRITDAQSDHQVMLTTNFDAEVFTNISVSEMLKAYETTVKKIVLVDGNHALLNMDFNEDVGLTERINPGEVKGLTAESATAQYDAPTAETYEPPAKAQRFLSVALGEDIAESVSADLSELFDRHVETCGIAAARRRYWKNALGLIVRRWVQAVSRLTGQKLTDQG